MQIFSEYIQPLSAWLYDHPYWALLITFLISFSESLAIVGSIIPGTVTMTAIGILAGSGVMRIDLTLIASTLGAIAGDGISYALGFYFRNSLPNWWPFNKYPHWIKYGQNYFARHGGKSVLIGRFIGPLRSIIPVIAGMMHMNQWYFFLANVTSAIGWAILYVVPGILIGAASSELTSENASRLFIFVLIILGLIWLTGLVLKWILLKTHSYLNIKLDTLWKKLRQSSFGYIVSKLTPEYEKNHFATVSLVLIFIINGLMIITLASLSHYLTFFSNINTAVYFLFHSLQTSAFDKFFIFISMLFQLPILITLFFSVSIYLIVRKDSRTLCYWLSLCFFTFISAYLLNQAMPLSRANLPSSSLVVFSFIDITTTISSSLLIFLMLYISYRYKTTLLLTLRVIIFVLLILCGFSVVYLSNNSFSSVVTGYLVGFNMSLGHWLFYRTKSVQLNRSQYPIMISFTVIFGVGLIYSFYNFEFSYLSKLPSAEEIVIDEQTWWQEMNTNLPLYTRNRIGQKTGIFNLQFAGNLLKLKSELLKKGWTEQPTDFFNIMINRINRPNETNGLPIIYQLYLKRKPSLVLTLRKKGIPDMVLQLWRSNTIIKPYHVLWIGTVHPLSKDAAYKKQHDNKTRAVRTKIMLELLNPEIKPYKLKAVEKSIAGSEQLKNSVEPEIILIKNIE